VTVALIAAVARNGVIGGDNRLIWRLKTDLQFFRQKTLGQPVLMGRRTFQSLGSALRDRSNIVLSRDPAFRAQDATIVRDIDTALALAGRPMRRRGRVLVPAEQGDEAVDPDGLIAPERTMVIGGGEIYRQTIDHACDLFITEVDLAPAGDARFPTIDPSLWQLADARPGVRGPEDECDFRFLHYVRRDRLPTQ
jgi:dihydrofolate reductase